MGGDNGIGVATEGLLLILRQLQVNQGHFHARGARLFIRSVLAPKHVTLAT